MTETTEAPGELRSQAAKLGLLYYYYDKSNDKHYTPTAVLRRWVQEYGGGDNDAVPVGRRPGASQGVAYLEALRAGTIPPNPKYDLTANKPGEARESGEHDGDRDYDEEPDRYDGNMPPEHQGNGDMDNDGEGQGEDDEDGVMAAARRAQEGQGEQDEEAEGQQAPAGGNEEELEHPAFDAILRKARQTLRNGWRHNILMVGPSGNGKTYIAAKVAERLDMEYGEISCSIGMSESQLLGRMLPTGDHGKFEWHDSEFLRLFEAGGVFCIDEVGAGDPNTLIILNSATSNGRLAVPFRTHAPIAHRHANFVLIACDNTTLDGANREYTARMAQDLAFVDRFYGAIFYIELNKDLEHRLIHHNEVLMPWANLVRERIVKNKMHRRVLTMRALMKYDDNLEYGDSISDVQSDFFALWSDKERSVMGDPLRDLMSAQATPKAESGDTAYSFVYSPNGSDGAQCFVGPTGLLYVTPYGAKDDFSPVEVGKVDFVGLNKAAGSVRVEVTTVKRLGSERMKELGATWSRGFLYTALPFEGQRHQSLPEYVGQRLQINGVSPNDILVFADRAKRRLKAAKAKEVTEEIAAELEAQA